VPVVGGGVGESVAEGGVEELGSERGRSASRAKKAEGEPDTLLEYPI
jgi:hypothetical protein